MSNQTQAVDVVIIGGGIIGSAVAYTLSLATQKTIAVLDIDLEGAYSSSERNAGGVRATFFQDINFDFSARSIQFFESIRDEIGFIQSGYLWLYEAERLATLPPHIEKWKKKEWPIETWDPATLRRQRPWIDKTADLAGAVFSARDGLINPNLLKNYYRKNASAERVIWIDRALVQGLREINTPARSVEVYYDDLSQAESSPENRAQFLAGEKKAFAEPLAKVKSVSAQYVINCAGPWASQLAHKFFSQIPSFAVRRQISMFSTRSVETLTPFGMTIDPSGVYFHPEANQVLAGFADRAEAPSYDFTYDGEAFFESKIWGVLYERSSHFGELKHQGGWSGLYEVSPDETAIIGFALTKEKWLRHRVIDCHSFSGHGVMHSYAAGLAVLDLIQTGKQHPLLSAERFLTGNLLHERAVI